MRQHDVTDPRKPKLAGSVHVGGITRRTAHPSGKVYAGGPQMVEISRDGKRVYWTNSLYSTWDNHPIPTACREPRSWLSPAQAAAWSWQRTTG